MYGVYVRYSFKWYLLIGMLNEVKYLAILYPVVQYSVNPYVAFLYRDGAYRTVARKKCIIKSVISLLQLIKHCTESVST